MAELTDIALVTQVAVFHNKRAYDQLVRKYQSPVRRFFLNQTLGDEQLSDDLAQETFIKAYVNITKFRGISSFSTWLFRIAVNCAKDAVRSAARRPAASLSFAGEEDEDGASEWDIPVTSGDTVPEDAVERRELILAVRRAVEALPEDQRQVVVMRDLSGLPYQEIADTLGIELGTVKSRLNRGRANLKTILENGNFL
jgi:RNA polymerase sigma-70 factor (ECF subfamily)